CAYQLSFQCTDSLLPVRGTEQMRTADKQSGACLYAYSGRFIIDAAVHFYFKIISMLFPHSIECFNLIHARSNEFLTAESGVHRHDQHIVNLSQEIAEAVCGCVGVEYYPRFHPVALNQLHDTVRVGRRFDVE